MEHQQGKQMQGLPRSLQILAPCTRTTRLFGVTVVVPAQNAENNAITRKCSDGEHYNSTMAIQIEEYITEFCWLIGIF